jgi:sugar phosphate permease
MTYCVLDYVSSHDLAVIAEGRAPRARHKNNHSANVPRSHANLPSFLTSKSLLHMMTARKTHALLVACNLFWYQAIRQTVGVLTVAMGLELGLGTKEKGWLIAAPSVGNILTQMFGSHVERAIGARATIACAVLGLGVGCLLVPVACTASLRIGLVVLAVQGFVFGPMFPAHSILLSRWLTPADRGPASAQGEIAMSIASMGAPLLIASLETVAGWRAGFYATGTVCVLYVCFVWLRLASSRPSECKYISKEELSMLESTTGQAPAAARAAASKKAASADAGSGEAAPAAVLTHPAILALFACHMAYNLTTLSINSWAPS